MRHRATGFVARSRITGRFNFKHYRHGLLLAEYDYPNLVVDAGLAAIAGNLILTGHTTAFSYLALGTDNTAPDPSDTALGSEITTAGGARALATLSRQTTSVTNDTAQLAKTFTFTAGGTFAITEAGAFDDPTSGIMLCRASFVAINVVPTDTLAGTYKISFAAA